MDKFAIDKKKYANRPFCFRSAEEKRNASPRDLQLLSASDHILDVLHFKTQAVVADIAKQWTELIRGKTASRREDVILREYDNYRVTAVKHLDPTKQAAWSQLLEEMKMIQVGVDRIYDDWMSSSRQLGAGNITSAEWQSLVAAYTKQFSTIAQDLGNKLTLFPQPSIQPFMACYAYKKVYSFDGPGKLKAEFPFRMAFRKLCAIKAK